MQLGAQVNILLSHVFAGCLFMGNIHRQIAQGLDIDDTRRTRSVLAQDVNRQAAILSRLLKNKAVLDQGPADGIDPHDLVLGDLRQMGPLEPVEERGNRHRLVFRKLRGL